jgi:hypothetical protein
MKRLFFITLGIIVATVGLALASGLEVEVGGEPGRGNTNPFYATRAAMRYQCMWLQSEINEPGPITKIEFKFHSYIGTPPSTFEGYQVILCHSSKDKLTTNFKANYDFKTPRTVYEGPLTIPAGLNQDEWFTVCTPTATFSYNNKNNMLMEVVWTEATGCRNLFWIALSDQPGRVRAYNATAATGVLLANQGEIARITISKPAVAPTSLGRVKALYN